MTGAMYAWWYILGFFMLVSATMQVWHEVTKPARKPNG